MTHTSRRRDRGALCDLEARGLLARAFRFATAHELAMAAAAAQQFRRAAALASAWRVCDLSQSVAALPLPAEAPLLAHLKSSAVSSSSSVVQPFPNFKYRASLVGAALTASRLEAAALPGCTCEGGVCCPERCECAALNPQSSLKSGISKTNSVLPFECHGRCPCACSQHSIAKHTAIQRNSEVDRRHSPLASSACPFRASQRRHIAQLAVVWRDPSKGWSLESRQSFTIGDAICDYTGELISSTEAKRRQSRRDEAFGSATSSSSTTKPPIVGGNYVLTIDEVFGDTTLRTCVDAACWGSAGRFANHSCAPNCAVRVVRVGSRVSTLVLVALRSIAAGEELTLNYGSGAPTTDETSTSSTNQVLPTRIVCRCGEASCKGFLPYDP